jgi:hypothetical protein
MLHAGLGNHHPHVARGECADGESKEEHKRHKRAEKEARHAEKARKHRLNHDEHMAKKNAEYLPLVQQAPCHMEPCETCGLQCAVPTPMPLGAKSDKEKSKKKKEKAKKDKEKKKEKGVHKPRDERHEAKLSKADRKREARLKKAAALARRDAKKRETTAEREAEAQALVREEREAKLRQTFRQGMNQLGAAQRLALNRTIDEQFHALERGIRLADELDSTVRVAVARRSLLALLGAYQEAFVADFNTVHDIMTARVTLSAPVGVQDDEHAYVVERMMRLVRLLREGTPAPLGDDVAAMSAQDAQPQMTRALDEVSAFLLTRTDEQRRLCGFHDAMLVQLHARTLVYDGAGQEAQANFTAYIKRTNADYAFIGAPTLAEFLAGLMRAHNIGKPKARQQAAARKREMEVEEKSEEWSEETSLYSDSEVEEEAPPPRRRQQEAGDGEEVLPERRVKGRFTVNDKQHNIVRPIMRAMQVQKEFFNLEMTNFLIELVRMTTLLPDVVSLPEMEQYFRALDVFQMTTFVVAERYEAEGGWRAFYLEDMVDQVYRTLRTNVDEKRKNDKAKRKEEANKRKREKNAGGGASTTGGGDDVRSTDDEESEQSQSLDETSVSVDSDDEDEEEEGGGDMVVEEKAVKRAPVEEELLRGAQAVEKKDALVGDQRFVMEFAKALFNVVVGRGDHSDERAEWDPRRKERKQALLADEKMVMQIKFTNEARRVIQLYEDNVRPDRYYIASDGAKKLIDAALVYAESLTGPIKKKAKQKEGDEQGAATAAGKGDTPMEKLQVKVGQLMEQALVYRQIAQSLADLMREYGVLPGYVLQKQDPFLHVEADESTTASSSTRASDDESSEESSNGGEFDSDDEEYRRGRRLVLWEE